MLPAFSDEPPALGTGTEDVLLMERIQYVIYVLFVPIRIQIRYVHHETVYGDLPYQFQT